VDVDGTGFAPGGVGLYVGISERDSFSATDASRYLGTIWTNSPGTPQHAVKADGTLDLTLSLGTGDISKLDPTKRYAVYTFKAHGQAVSDPSQTVEIPLDLDFSDLGLAPEVSAKAVSQSQDGLTLAVSGGAFPETYDAATFPGVYVFVRDAATRTRVGGNSEQLWLAPAGAPPYVTGPIDARGNFDAQLVLTAATVATLDRTKEYELFVRPAHTATVPEPTFALPLDLDFAALQGKIEAVPVLTVGSAPTTLKPGTATVTVGHPAGTATGDVTVSFTQGDTVRTVTRTLSSGAAQIDLPLLAAGTWSVRVDYAGDVLFGASSTTTTVTVARAAAARPVVRVTQRPTTVAPGRATVTVPSGTGRVTLSLTRGTTRRVVAGTLARGTTTVALPALAAGTWTAKADYAGSANLEPSTSSLRLAVAKATVGRPVVQVVSRPTSRRAGSLRVTVRSTTAGRPTGTVRVQLVKGTSRRTYAVRLNSRGQATVRTSRLARGTWKVLVAYRGDTRFAPRAQLRVTNLRVVR